MRKQVLRTVLVTATAFSIAVMPALTVCAEDVTEPIIAKDETIEIDGNVNVTLNKDQGNALYASDGGEIIVDKDVNITYSEKPSGTIPVIANNDSTIWIHEDYNCDSNYDWFTSATAYGSKLIIDGNYNSNVRGVNVHEGNLYVTGDISAKNDALYLSVEGVNIDNYVVVKGTIKAENGNAILIDSIKGSDGTAEGIVNQLPDVAVFAIEAKDEEHLISVDYIDGQNKMTKAQAAAIKKETVDLFAAAINYIIHTEGADFSFEGEGLKTASDFGIDDLDKNFTTTRYGETFTATVASNYVVEGNNSVAVEKISDGVYSVKLIDHKGGILLKATALYPDPTPGPNPDQPTVIIIPDTTPSSESSSSSSGSSSEAASYSAIPAGAITISLPRTTAATVVATAGPAVLGANREAARTASFKMAQLTDAQYKDAFISNISATPAGGLFRVETDRIATFDRTMLEAFAKKGNVDLEVLFPLGGKKFSVMIPAGTDINKLLDDKGYCGFLRLLSILGGEIVTK